MLDRLRTRRNSITWLQWVAVVAPALWLTLQWAMQLRGGARREGRAKRGARFFHPLVQLALDQGAGADPRTRRHWTSSWLASVDSWLPPPEEACMYVLASRLDVYVGITAASRVTACTATYLGSCVLLLGAPGRDPQACSPGPVGRAEPQSRLFPAMPSRARGYARGCPGTPQ